MRICGMAMAKWLFCLCILMGKSLFAEIGYDAKGIPWQYTSSTNRVTAIWGTAGLRRYNGKVEIPEHIGGKTVTSLGAFTFNGCKGITEITIPASIKVIGMYPFFGSGVKRITFLGEEILDTESYLFTEATLLETIVFPKRIKLGTAPFRWCESLRVCLLPKGTEAFYFREAFYRCSSLEYARLPPVLSKHWMDNGTWDASTFEGCNRLQQVVFTGKAPEAGGSVEHIPNRARITYPMADAAAWGDLIPEERRGTFTELIDAPEVTLSSKMLGPRAMEVTFSVEGTGEEVMTRAIAVKDGEVSFDNVIPIRSLSSGTLGKLPTNVQHRFVWDIAKDWEADLENVKPVVLVREASLLPIDEVTLPGEGALKPFTVNRVPLHWSQVFNLLLWCYAEGDARLSVSQGVVSVDGTPIVRGKEVINLEKALEYLWGKVGYRAMTEEEARHWERVTRVSFASYGLGTLQVKIKEGE